MNFNFYIFGNPSDEYEQYPNDDSVKIIKPRIDNLVNERFVIHKENDIMYYMFAVKFNDTQYIGYCFVINGLSIINVQEMLTILEKITPNLEGILGITNNKCKYVIEHFFQKSYEIRLLRNIIEPKFKSLNITNLDNYNLYRKDRVVFKLNEYNDTVKQSLNDYETIIFDNDYPDDNSLATNMDNSLKRFAIVILPLALVSMAYNLFVLSFEIENYKKQNSKLGAQNQSLLAKINSQNNNPYKYVNIMQQVPFIIWDIEFKDSSTEIKYSNRVTFPQTAIICGKVHYFSAKLQPVNLTIKIRKDSLVYPFTQSIDIFAFRFSRFETFEIIGHRWMDNEQWDKGNYHYEIWYDNQCLGVKQFAIE